MITLLKEFTFIMMKTIISFLLKNIIYNEGIAVVMAAGIALIITNAFLSL